MSSGHGHGQIKSSIIELCLLSALGARFALELVLCQHSKVLGVEAHTLGVKPKAERMCHTSTAARGSQCHSAHQSSQFSHMIIGRSGLYGCSHSQYTGTWSGSNSFFPGCIIRGADYQRSSKDAWHAHLSANNTVLFYKSMSPDRVKSDPPDSRTS